MFARLIRRPLISVCIPAYRGQGFIGETILSALAQTVDDIEIIISNDGNHPTPDLEAFRAEPRIRRFGQSRRLGWVANSNFVISKARGRYFMILPHDDVLGPEYLEACLGVLEQDKDVFAAYSDIATDRGVMRASEVRGPVEDRIGHVMRDLFNGYSYRALMPRRPEARRFLRLTPNPPSDFCVDTTWILQQACLGELRRVARPLYWKRISDHSTHMAWWALPRDQLAAAWQQHCRQMGEIAATRIRDAGVVSELVMHRSDARRVPEAPPQLKAAMG